METQNLLKQHAFELFRSLAENNRDGVLVWDREGRLLYANQEASRLFNSPNKMNVGQTLEELFDPELAQTQRELLKEILMSEVPLTRRIKSSRSTGEQCIEIRLSPLRSPEQKPFAITGVLCIQADHEKIEAQLAHTSKLASMGTLAAGIAHEINNPLAVISGNISILEDILHSSAQNPILTSALEKMKRCTERVADIVSGMRNYVRINSDVNTPVDIHSSLKNVLGMITNVCQKSGITIKTNLCKEAAIIRGDAGKLEQIIMNILINSKDALLTFSKEGTIEIKTVVTDHQVILQISDNGCGIAPENMDRIFDLFFTTKPAGMGTGLGLSLCQAMVSALGGVIQIDSEVGIGTQVNVTFNRENQVPMSEPILLKETPAVKFSGTALVVDDEEMIRDVLGSMLKNLGFEVKEADDGDSALKALKTANGFDYVFTDLKMRRMSGQEFLIEAKKLQRENTKYVIITGGMLMEYTEAERAVLREIADGFLKKPFQKKTIITLLETMNKKEST